MSSIRQAIAERIKEVDLAQPKPLFFEVAGSAKIEEVLKNKNVTTGAYVIKLRAAATAKSEPYQRVTEQYAVVTTTRNVVDAFGADAGEVAEQLQNRVWQALSGFAPNGADPLLWVGGDLVQLRDGNHIYQDVYQTEYTIDPAQN